MKNEIKISLIIPIYNVENYLERCLDSAINQTFKEIEIIIVNDGSTDSSLQICHKYKKNDNRIILINQENTGLGMARNNAIKISKGEFLCFLDSDDWLDLVALEKSYYKALNTMSDIVVFGFDRIDEKTYKVIQSRDDFTFNLEEINKNDFFKKVISANFKHMACAMLVKTELFTKNSLKFPSTLHEDLYVTPQLFYYARKVSFIKKDYYKWLIRKGSITNTITSNHIDGIITAIFYNKYFLLKEHIYYHYEEDFIRFYLTYINLLYLRIKSFVQNTNHKKELLNELIIKSASIINIKKIEQYNLDVKNYNDFLTLYKIFFNKKDFSDTLIINNTLESQLNEIRNSKGYKVLLKYYKYRDKILPIGSLRRKFFKSIIKEFILGYKSLNFFNISFDTYKKNYNVVFLPHKDYHVLTMGLIARELKKNNISSCILDLTDYYRDEGGRKKAKEFVDIDFLDFGLLKNNKLNFDCLICMNDWDKKVVRPQIEIAKRNKKITIGIVEGIQDFFDLDTNQNRQPYKTVEYTFLTGKYDKQFFQNKLNKIMIVGVPRLKELLKEKPIFPQIPIAVINMNFSYNVLTDKAEFWLESIIQGCRKANINYIITQHPADKTDLSKYNVSSKNMYDTIREGSIIISRFGSIIIEALAMGKPVVYHNPHNEKVIKFQEPIGAYSLSFDSNSLSKAIKYELSLCIDYRERANKFLNFHCNINEKIESKKIISKYITILLNNKSSYKE